MTTQPHTHEVSLAWQLDERAAAAYERHLVPRFMAPGAEALVGLAGLRPGERVLDVACATGSVARRAAPEVGPAGRVVGLDLNAGMLAVARDAAAGLRPPIEWLQVDATAMPLPDAAFDAVISHLGLMFFGDPWGALREMHRVLEVGGRLVLTACRPLQYSPGYVAFADVLDRHVGPEAGAAMRSPFPAWELPELRDLVTSAGFDEVRVFISIAEVRWPSAAEWVEHEGASSPFAAALAALGAETREALARDLADALPQYADDDGIVFPIEIHVVAAGR